MRLGQLGGRVLLLFACSACAEAIDEAGSTEGAATVVAQPTHFAISSGAERLAQHHDEGNDVVEVEKRSLRFDHGYWLARLGEISYENADVARAKLQEIGLPNDDDHVRFFENKCTDTQAFYVTTQSLSTAPERFDDPFNRVSPEFAALVFRGTEATRATDIKTDLSAWNRPGQSPLGNVHAGFSRALDSVWNIASPECGLTNPIQTLLAAQHEFDGRTTKPFRRGAELYFVGHSMGGAIATLALARTLTDACADEAPGCASKYIPVSGLYTYGAPRTFDMTFANSLTRAMQDRTPIFRFVHENDGVPFLPGKPFRHPGFDGSEADYLIFLEADRALVGEARPAADVSGALVTDHFIASYLEALAARLPP